MLGQKFYVGETKEEEKEDQKERGSRNLHGQTDLMAAM